MLVLLTLSSSCYIAQDLVPSKLQRYPTNPKVVRIYGVIEKDISPPNIWIYYGEEIYRHHLAIDWEDTCKIATIGDTVNLSKSHGYWLITSKYNSLQNVKEFSKSINLDNRRDSIYNHRFPVVTSKLR